MPYAAFLVHGTEGIQPNRVFQACSILTGACSSGNVIVFFLELPLCNLLPEFEIFQFIPSGISILLAAITLGIIFVNATLGAYSLTFRTAQGYKWYFRKNQFFDIRL
jgi:hypothetical protein